MLFDYNGLWTREGLLSTCKHIRQTYGPNIAIPTAYDPNVLEVFDATEVQPNVFRFVTYILWLDTQPEAYAKYLHVKLNRSNLWAKCVNKLCQLKY